LVDDGLEVLHQADDVTHAEHAAGHAVGAEELELIRGLAHADEDHRREAPRLYNVLENLCISRGIPMPALPIIETPALNAYAAGLKEGEYVIAVTRGLMETLSDDELEAVLGHELTHIRNRDTQLMVIAIIFAGIFAFVADLVI